MIEFSSVLNRPRAMLRTPFALLENRRDPAAPAQLYRGAQGVIACSRADGLPAAFKALEEAVQRGLHAVGFLSYELGYVLEAKLAPLLPERRSVPLLWFALFPPPRLLTPRHADAWFGRAAPPPPLEGLRFGHDRNTHGHKVSHILDLIHAGDLYQANLTFPIRFRYEGDPLQLYAALRARQPAAHGGIVATGSGILLSISPELFLSIEGGQAIVRPMKGTIARGTTQETDDAARVALLADPKQRAENLMIVDLMRNDLSRVSLPGSVKVPALCTVETYPGFHTLTSTVTARLKQGVSLEEIFRALFPCGSVVGAPKIRACEVIRALEAAPRDVYTGAIGVIRPGGLHLNVAIRTAWLDGNGNGVYGVGGGIVADSAPNAEYDEALLKGHVLTGLAADYALIETLRWRAGAGFVRLAGHLSRMARSAAALGFAYPQDEILRGLHAASAGWTKDQRVRLLLQRDGRLELTAVDAPAFPARSLRLHIASQRLDRGDPFLRHKTTVRGHYDAAVEEAAREGCDEALLLNRAGAVADGARMTLFVQRGGRVRTPPLRDGALPGVLRAMMLQAGWASVAPLSLEDLRDADALYLGNSLRGLLPALLSERDPRPRAAVAP